MCKFPHVLWTDVCLSCENPISQAVLSWGRYASPPFHLTTRETTWTREYKTGLGRPKVYSCLCYRVEAAQLTSLELCFFFQCVPDLTDSSGHTPFGRCVSLYAYVGSNSGCSSGYYCSSNDEYISFKVFNTNIWKPSLNFFFFWGKPVPNTSSKWRLWGLSTLALHQYGGLYAEKQSIAN